MKVIVTLDQGQTFAGPAEAQFVRYSSGVWAMTKFILAPGTMQAMWWDNLNVTEAKKKGAGGTPIFDVINHTNICNNEMKAIGVIRGLNSDEAYFEGARGVKGVGTIEDLRRTKYNNEYLGMGIPESGVKDGYRFTVVVNGLESFIIVAVPVAPGKTGKHGFALYSEEGQIRSTRDGSIPSRTDPPIRNGCDY